MGAHGVKSSPGSTKTDCKTPFGSSEAIFPPPSPVLPSQKGEGHAGEFQSEPCKECRWVIRNLCRCSCSSLSPPLRPCLAALFLRILRGAHLKSRNAHQKNDILSPASWEVEGESRKPLRKAETHRVRAQGLFAAAKPGSYLWICCWLCPNTLQRTPVVLFLVKAAGSPCKPGLNYLGPAGWKLTCRCKEKC